MFSWGGNLGKHRLGQWKWSNPHGCPSWIPCCWTNGLVQYHHWARISLANEKQYIDWWQSWLHIWRVWEEWILWCQPPWMIEQRYAGRAVRTLCLMSAPSTGSNGISSAGYGDRSEACLFLIRLLALSQCMSLYDVSFKIACSCQGPVYSYWSLLTIPSLASE